MLVSVYKGKQRARRGRQTDEAQLFTQKKIFLSVTAGVVLVVFLAGAAGAAYISGKMDLLSALRRDRRQQPERNGPRRCSALLDGMDLSGIDVMENGGSIAPPEGGVNINSGVINVLLIGSDERENSADGSARADSIMMLSVDSRKKHGSWYPSSAAWAFPFRNRGDDWLTHTYAWCEPADENAAGVFQSGWEPVCEDRFFLFETAITDIGGVVGYEPGGGRLYERHCRGAEMGTGHGAAGWPTPRWCMRACASWTATGSVERQREVVQAAADQVATLSLPKLDLIANKLLPRIETNLTNGELWQLLFKMPVLLGKQAQQMTVPEREETWSISSGLQSSLIGCDFAAEADRLDRFTGGVVQRGADHACGSPVCIKNECMENQNGAAFMKCPQKLDKICKAT